MKGAILLVSYGAADQRVWERSIGMMLAELRAAYPTWKVCQAFTGRRMIAKWQQQGLSVMDETKALEELAQQGFRRVTVLPTHLVRGKEYERVENAVRQYQERFSAIQLEAPLLERDGQRHEIAQALLAAAQPGPEETLVLVGHGTTPEGNRAYRKLQEELNRQSAGEVRVETLESIATAVERIRGRHIVLMPLLLTAGKHTMQDIGGPQAESAAGRLRAAGFRVRVMEKGLGELATIRKLYYNGVNVVNEGATV